MKKSIVLLLLSALLLLTACQTGDTPTTTTDTTGETTSATEELTTPEELETADPDAVTPYFVYSSMSPISFNTENISATVENSVLVYRSDDQRYGYNAWPTLCRDEEGNLYTVFSGDRLTHVCPYGKTIMCKSTDGGKTWTEVGVINDSVMDDRDAGILYIGSGKMVISYFCHHLPTYLNDSERANILEEARKAGVYDEVNAKLLDMEQNPDKYNKQGNYVRISEDYGATWGDPIKLPVSAPHGPILHSSGKLLYAGKISHDTNYHDAQLALFESPDQGKTWNPVSAIPVPYGLSLGNMWEMSLVELAGGRLLAAIRVQDAGLPSDWDFTMYTCYSDDGGRSWSTPEETGICGSPPQLTRLSDGSVVLSYTRRIYPHTIRAVVSTDGGETWSEELTLATSPTGDVGYPSTVELDDHTLVTVYYKWGDGDTKPSIFSVRWKLN